MSMQNPNEAFDRSQSKYLDFQEQQDRRYRAEHISALCLLIDSAREDGDDEMVDQYSTQLNHLLGESK